MMTIQTAAGRIAGATLMGTLGAFGQTHVHVWEKVEIALTATQPHTNAYLDVEVWVQLEGPGFSQRCQGFWDGGAQWRVRVMATAPGVWSWTSGSNQDDAGLNGRAGAFQAVAWTEAEKAQNPLRRGMPRPTASGHAFEYADGTPLFWLADTWWSCMTKRFPWQVDGLERAVGTPDAGFQDFVRFRKSQGFNGCMVIAAFPNWTETSSAWGGGDWTDEAGNRAFFGEGVTPDLNRINPAYFQSMDRKVDHLNAQGFIPFIETARRDIGAYWKAGYGWPDSYARYLRYLWFRYQGNLVFNSPIHLDAAIAEVSNAEWNQAANLIVDRYGWPPFKHLASANPPSETGSTLETFGHTDQARWLSFHSAGNFRNHMRFPLLTAMFSRPPPVPCLNNEPYYDGLRWGDHAPPGSELAAYYCRVALYGSVLSGGLAGHVYGAEHIWDGDEKMPQAFLAPSAEQMHHIRAFLLHEGCAYQHLEPARSLLTPHQTPHGDKNQGWAYCMRTVAKDLFLLYFEKACPQAVLGGALPGATYGLHWFSPASGTWGGTESVKADGEGVLALPNFPDGQSLTVTDWAVLLKRGV